MVSLCGECSCALLALFPPALVFLFRDRHGPGEDGHLLNLSLRLSAKGV